MMITLLKSVLLSVATALLKAALTEDNVKAVSLEVLAWGAQKTDWKWDDRMVQRMADALYEEEKRIDEAS